MVEKDIIQKPILMVANIPEFRNQGVLWFKENEAKIKNQAAKNLWWKNHIKILQTDEKINSFNFMRELADLNYIKVSRVLKPGEYSFLAGRLILWPVNLDQILQIDFYGNEIESLEILPLPTIKLEKDILEEVAQIYTHFKPGDYVVHQDHGIGRFKGTTADLENYYEIEYADKDKLFLPFSQLKKISLYIGFSRPKIYRLAGSLWHRVKNKAKEDIIKLAKELLQFYAHREIQRGFEFVKNSPELKQLIADFEYPETPDQIKAWQEIEFDMENDKPMDRILVGDVGFGKTELALRAAFKAALSGKQAVLIAPTTILAQQHFEVFSKRLYPYPVKVGMLSRLQPALLNRQIIQEVKNGQADIIIGTHRLLSRDVVFKDLGLLIIDEEQRFGVLQKEKLKRLKANIDILMLSATPIPRTLYLSLSNLKTISSIQTPPLGRQAIETKIEKFSWLLIKKAIEMELSRQGQVFFLENRIHKIGAVISELKKILPHLKITSLHGRMSENEIIKSIGEFKSGKSNILVATTIIENGLDLPNVNTLIVSDATCLGLAQAHQLRGRVGRRDQKAVVYFLHPQKFQTPLVQSRLKALQEFSSLGDGFKLALRDLELRGAGNILGKNQSGHINQIGLNLYCEMLSHAVEKLKN